MLSAFGIDHGEFSKELSPNGKKLARRVGVGAGVGGAGGLVVAGPVGAVGGAGLGSLGGIAYHAKRKKKNAKHTN